MEYKVGKAYYLYDNRAERNECKAHILAILPHPELSDDNLIVYRWWGKHKRYWFYGVTTYWQQDIWADYVGIILAKKQTIKQNEYGTTHI